MDTIVIIIAFVLIITLIVVINFKQNKKEGGNCVYNEYEDAISYILKDKNLSNFKRDDSYRAKLEHVRWNEGLIYLGLIRTEMGLSDSEIIGYCSLNDSVGDPILKQYGDLHISPTSLRYIYHTYLIFMQCKLVGMNNIDFVEVGGGYGGLCFAIHHFADRYKIRIKSYTIIDLANPLGLQKLYLKKFLNHAHLRFINASTFGKNIHTKNMFLISNYCFSEISLENQHNYIKYLFPKVKHGFMVWNFIDPYDIGFDTTIVDEYPQTGKTNKYITF